MYWIKFHPTTIGARASMDDGEKDNKIMALMGCPKSCKPDLAYTCNGTGRIWRNRKEGTIKNYYRYVAEIECTP